MKKLSDNFIYGIYSCRLLSSVLNGAEPVAMPEGMTLEGLYAYQNEQDVTNMAYVALQKLDRFFFDGEKPDDELIEIAEFVFNNSTFGNAENRLVLDYDKQNGEKRTLWGNITYFMDRWGLNYSQMKERYKVLKYLPFLLPFCWIYRLITALLFRRNTIKSSVDDVGKMNSDFSDYVNHIMEISNAKVNK